jgi:hypothetical protein
MPEETSAVIKRFQLWVYTGSPLLHDEGIKDTPWKKLIWLYLFADRYCIPDLQNSVIDNIAAKQQALSTVPMAQLHLIYDNTPSTSPLRRYMIDLSAQLGHLDEWFAAPEAKAFLGRYPHAFLLDLAVEQYNLRKKHSKTHDWKALGCTYHVHPSTTPAR